MKIECNYISKCLERAVDISLVLPSPVYVDTIGLPFSDPNYTPQAKYPVVYLLHGIGNDHRSWFGYTRAELYAEEHNIALVAFSGENKFYIDHGKEKWEEFLQEELPTLIAGYFPVSQRPEDTYLAGLSMGGYGAMLNGLHAPERYHAVGCFSGAIDKLEYDKTPENRQRYDIHTLLASALDNGIRLPEFYLSCGEDDFIYESSLRLAKNMEALGVCHHWSSVPGYRHEWRFWDSQLEQFLNWLPRTDDYAGKNRNV